MFIFLKILAPGLSEETRSDAKAELATFISSVLHELSIEVEGLDIGNVFTGSVGAVGRGWAGLPLCFAGCSLVLVCCGPQRLSMQDECAKYARILTSRRGTPV